ncbi:zinc-binding dehydrogenase [Nonomuraea thailandensis]
MRGPGRRNGLRRRPLRHDRQRARRPPDLSHRGVTTTLHQVREDGTGLAELVKLVETGDLRLRLDSSFPIAEVRKAFERFETRGLTGKVALVF